MIYIIICNTQKCEWQRTINNKDPDLTFEIIQRSHGFLKHSNPYFCNKRTILPLNVLIFDLWRSNQSQTQKRYDSKNYWVTLKMHQRLICIGFFLATVYCTWVLPRLIITLELISRSSWSCWIQAIFFWHFIWK